MSYQYYRTKANLMKYLTELSILSDRVVREEEIILDYSADEIRVLGKDIESYGVQILTVDFTYLSSASMSSLANALFALNPTAIWLYTEWCDIFGLYKLKNIKNFNFKFPYDINENGIFGLVCDDFEDSIKLSFYDEGNGKECDITLSGKNWGNIDLTDYISG